jgi:hypothetical protein
MSSPLNHILSQLDPTNNLHIISVWDILILSSHQSVLSLAIFYFQASRIQFCLIYQFLGLGMRIAHLIFLGLIILTILCMTHKWRVKFGGFPLCNCLHSVAYIRWAEALLTRFLKSVLRVILRYKVSIEDTPTWEGFQRKEIKNYVTVRKEARETRSTNDS